jgi:hypothetical protein
MQANATALGLAGSREPGAGSQDTAAPSANPIPATG